MSKELKAILESLKEILEKFKELTEAKDKLYKKKNVTNGHKEKLIERAKLIAKIEEGNHTLASTLRGEEKQIGKIIKEKLSEFALAARKALDLENLFQLEMLLDHQDNKKEGYKNDLEKLIDYIERLPQDPESSAA